MGDSFGTAFERICRRCFFLQDLRLRSIPPTAATVPKFGEETSSAAKAEPATPAAWSAEGSTVSPKVPVVGPSEAKDGVAKEPELEKTIVLPKSPPVEAELRKVTKAPATTPKRRRMASLLDAVIETTKALTSVPAKKVAEAATAQAEAEAGPLVPIETKPAMTEDKAEQKLQIPAWQRGRT
jgi:hypothetical protein